MLGGVGHQIAHVTPQDIQDAIQDEACMPDIRSAGAERLIVSYALSSSNDTVLQDHMPALPKRLLTTKIGQKASNKWCTCQSTTHAEISKCCVTKLCFNSRFMPVGPYPCIILHNLAHHNFCKIAQQPAAFSVKLSLLAINDTPAHHMLSILSVLVDMLTAITLRLSWFC